MSDAIEETCFLPWRDERTVERETRQVCMFNKNLKYFRLKNSMTKKDLAEHCNLTPMAITNYENGSRKPSMDIIKRMAEVLNVRVSDFLMSRNAHLSFVHGEFRKKTSLTATKQAFIRESVEEHLSRFFSVVEFLGDNVLPEAPLIHYIKTTRDPEEDAKALRRHLGIAEEGPVGNLISILENKGVLVYMCDIDDDSFSGMNGTVNGRPYIIANKNMSPERNRSTISHELAHIFFQKPEGITEKEEEQLATAISGAFLFPCADAIRELGIRRNRITKDMDLVCHEYGISMYILVKRAQIAKIISEETAKKFYVMASKQGWRTHEPVRIPPEKPLLFEQLVFRAVCENEISIQKGAELLQMPYNEVRSHCLFAEVENAKRVY